MDSRDIKSTDFIERRLWFRQSASPKSRDTMVGIVDICNGSAAL